MSAARHGTRARYTAGCGCADCTAANTRDMREWRRRDGPGRVLEAANRRRQYHRQQLAMRWVREHRPDVWAVILDEAWRLVEAEQQREAS